MLIELPFSVVPRTEVQTVAAILNEPVEQIEGVLKYQLYCSIGFNGETEFFESSASTRLTGSEALLRLAELKNVMIPSVRELNIPSKFFIQKPDLFDLTSILESRLWRIQTLVNVNAPELVLKNEKHALCNAVWKILEFPV